MMTSLDRGVSLVLTISFSNTLFLVDKGVYESNSNSLLIRIICPIYGFVVSGSESGFI